MRKTIEHSLVLVLATFLVAMLGSPAQAASSVVQDPTGDVGSAAPYLDVDRAQVTEQQGAETLLFMMQLAGRIPEAPSASDLIWPFHVDTDPTTVNFPGGPFTSFNDYVVRVRWFNGEFVGQVVDRTGAAPLVTPVRFSIDGRTVKVFVPLATLGDPSTFGWNAATRPGATVPYVDFAPDGGSVADLATWTK